MMESILWFENMLSSTDPIPMSTLCSPTEDIIIEDSFANEIYMKYVDESSSDHIDLFTEIDRNHTKTMSSDDFNVINEYVTPIASIDEDVKNNISFDTMANNTNNNNNDQFMMEFNSILDSVQLSNELTPPQTPPPEIFSLPSPIYQQQHQQLNIPNNNGQYEIYEYQIQENSLSNDEEQQQQQQYIYSTASSSPSLDEETSQVAFDADYIISSPTDIQRELEVVDELVRAHSRNNSDLDDSASVSAFSVWSPAQSDYSGGSSSSGSSLYGDDEIITSKARKTTSSSSSGLKGVTKKRPRAYGRNPEEKKYRKKEQNKNAATRYRQKKKQEIEVIIGEENILLDKNRKLMASYKETKREVKYLKSLLRDLFKARGFI